MNNKKRTINIGLCEGRHDIVVNNKRLKYFVFDKIEDVCNPKKIEEQAIESLNKFVTKDVTNINLYVTGLTVALISALNACKKLGITPKLFHYDKKKNKYFSQNIIF